MYFRIFLVFILLFSSKSNSDDSFIFKVVQSENKICKISMKIIAKSEFDFQGSQEITDKIKSSGVVLPMNIDQDQITFMKVETFTKDKDGYIPFSGGIDSIYSRQYINGQLNTKINATPLDTSFKMDGYYKDNVMIINEIKGNAITTELEDALKQTLSKMMKSIEFPENPLKIGDKFSQTIPISIPVQGIANVNMTVTTQYTLKNYVSSVAYFDIEQEYELTSEADKNKIFVNGSGNGTMIFDSKLSQMTSMITKSIMKMNIDAGDMIVISNSDTQTEMIVTVTDKN
jgi:hypothetical protein